VEESGPLFFGNELMYDDPKFIVVGTTGIPAIQCDGTDDYYSYDANGVLQYYVVHRFWIDEKEKLL